MIVAADQDINVRGSNLISDNGTVLKAGHDIDISTAHNLYTGNEYHESKKSGVMGTGGLGFTIGNRKTTDDTDRTNIVHTGSIIGSLNGDTVTVAGNRYRQTGSTVSSPEGRNTVTAKSIDVESANNRYATDYVHTQEQKGLTVALNVPVVQAAQNFVQAAQNVGKSKNKRVNAMAAANAAWQGYQAAQQMQQFAPSSSAGQGQNNNQSSGISVSITYGEQKSRNEQKSRYTEAAASQIISKGQTTLAATGGGEQSNINITGSDVIGHAGTTLIADNHINLQSAKQDGSEQSKNKSSGWNAGVAVQIGDGISLGITAGGNLGKGKGQGESTTHRHTHIGSTAGQTTIRSGGDTTLKGAQLIGKGVQADTRNLHIESVQDTETYQSKQQNGNVQVTVGYGFSASGSYSQSKVKADHASVTEQSGIYAGEDGYQIKVRDNTDLKGGIITSGKSAEDKGKNRFQTATLTHSDIQNHSRYEGKSFGIGGRLDLNGGWDGTVTDKQGRPADRISSAAGYGSDGDSKNSTTRSGINTRNIHITDEAGQLARTGRTAKETEARIYTGIDTETADQHSGRLKNSFDKDAVAKEINLQREVTQEFGGTLQGLNAEIERSLDGLKEKLAKGEIDRKEYEDGLKVRQRGKVLLNMIGAGLSAPTDSAAGIAAATASPALSYQIGQYFKGLAQENPDGRLTARQETAHILAHGVLGAAVSAAGGNDALAGALASGGAEAAAPVIGKWLYGKDDGVSLSAEEKETVSAITRMLGTAAGAATGNSAADAVRGGMAADGAVGNNFETIFTPQQNDYLASVMSLAQSSLTHHNGDVDLMMQDINNFMICLGCKDDASRYIEFLVGVSNEVSMTIITGGAVHVIRGAKAVRYLNTLRKVTQNETAVAFTINGAANASMNAAFDDSQRTAGNFTYNFVVGGTAGKLASKMPNTLTNSLAQGAVYGSGELAKHTVYEDGQTPPRTGDVWLNAGKAFVGGTLGGFTGTKISNSIYGSKIPTNAKVAVDAFSGSTTSSLYGYTIEKAQKKKEQKKRTGKNK